MKCSDAQSFFDQMIREGKTFKNSDVRRHIRECEVCSREYIRWCAIARKFSDAPPLQAPPALYTRIMQEIDKNRAERSLVSALTTQLKSQFVYVPVAVTALLLFAAGAMILLQKQLESTKTAPAISRNDAPVHYKNEDTVTAHFKFAHATAKKVTVVGDFNQWDKRCHQLQKDRDGTWTIDLQLPKGCYQYLFYIDEAVWKTDPLSKESAPDGFGGFNTVIEL